jgi:hypothetical protein
MATLEFSLWRVNFRFILKREFKMAAKNNRESQNLFSLHDHQSSFKNTSKGGECSFQFYNTYHGRDSRRSDLQEKKLHLFAHSVFFVSSWTENIVAPDPKRYLRPSTPLP